MALSASRASARRCGLLLLDEVGVGALRLGAIFAVGRVGCFDSGGRKVGDLADGGAADHGAGFDEARDVMPG